MGTIQDSRGFLTKKKFQDEVAEKERVRLEAIEAKKKAEEEAVKEKKLEDGKGRRTKSKDN